MLLLGAQERMSKLSYPIVCVFYSSCLLICICRFYKASTLGVVVFDIFFPCQSDLLSCTWNHFDRFVSTRSSQRKQLILLKSVFVCQYFSCNIVTGISFLTHCSTMKRTTFNIAASFMSDSPVPTPRRIPIRKLSKSLLYVNFYLIFKKILHTRPSTFHSPSPIPLTSLHANTYPLLKGDGKACLGDSIKSDIPS